MTDLLLAVTPQNLFIAAVMYVGFIVFLFACTVLLPGRRMEGFAQPDGARLQYKLNGWLLFAVTNLAVIGGTVFFELSLTPILQYFWSLFIVANIVSVLWTVQLFVSGRRSPAYTGQNDSSLPTWLHDIWFGPLRNPTLWGVDIKMFAYQPSLIGLWLVVVAFAYRQYELHGVITPQMWLYQLFWAAYWVTHFGREDFMLSTWDIIAEHFGFMLVWGDLVYVTFFYSIGGWFIVDWLEPMPMWAIGVLVALHVVGHWIFREANWQKDRYKHSPQATIWGKKAETLGGKLLVSGWWGIGRKINYTGELMVYLSFALCAGFQSWIPYMLPLSLMILLFHRAARDDKKCRAKYGELWGQYCQRVRFRIVPFVY